MPKKPIKEVIHAQGFDIGIYTTDFQNEYVSLTDIARYRSLDPRITVHNWLRGRDIVEFLGLWETLHNPNFKRVDFDTFKMDAGSNAFVFSIKKWNDELGAVGLISKSGRYGGGIDLYYCNCKHCTMNYKKQIWEDIELILDFVAHTETVLLLTR